VRKFKIILHIIIFPLKISAFWDVPPTLFIFMRPLICWDISTQTLPKRRLLKTSELQRQSGSFIWNNSYLLFNTLAITFPRLLGLSIRRSD
jgi:hypothetical protein